jgi:hypothetical protein
MSPVQEYAQSTLAYLEQDLVSFEAVFANPHLKGKLGVAMIVNAAAALDLFAWLLYQRFDLTLKNNALFKQMISDKRFFGEGTFYSPEVLYGIVRCGVVHQFYPKGILIAAELRDEPFFQRDGKIYVNALGFYRTVLAGLRRVRDHINVAPGPELADLDTKFELRQRIDKEALEGAKLDAANLPSF